MSKRRLYLCQANGRFGINVYVPLSAGLLWAYARQFPEIESAYEACDFLYAKEPIPDAVSRLHEPDLLAVSDYIWSAAWNRAFVRAVKERWPKCVVIVGGVNVWDESPRTLAENQDFDFAIYGEGEGAFADFLRQYASSEPDYSAVGSLVWRNGEQITVNERRAFVDLKTIPSPYLDGVFNGIWQKETRWQALQETHRGCPYACT